MCTRRGRVADRALNSQALSGNVLFTDPIIAWPLLMPSLSVEVGSATLASHLSWICGCRWRVEADMTLGQKICRVMVKTQ
jgi:hypothetical protein